MAGEEAAATKERMWNMQDWCWDPYNMLALSSDGKGKAGSKGLGPSLGQGPIPLAPASSLLLDDVAKAGSRGKGGAATCQVDGCAQELTNLKEYHQR